MYLNSAFIVSGFFLQIASMILSIYLVFQVLNRNKTEDHRSLCLGALAFQLGFLVGPVIHHLAEFEPQILIQALVYTGVAFTSFSVISLFSKRRSFLYLGGLIMTIVNVMIFYRLIGWLLGYSAFNMAYLMVGMFVACLYIIYDTQVIVEKAERGDKDVPTHTMTLFIDLFDLFIRILQILMKLNEDKREERRRK